MSRIVGVIGAGRMGLPIIGHLATQGLSRCWCTTRTPPSAQRVEAAARAGRTIPRRWPRMRTRSSSASATIARCARCCTAMAGCCAPRGRRHDHRDPVDRAPDDGAASSPTKPRARGVRRRRFDRLPRRQGRGRGHAAVVRRRRRGGRRTHSSPCSRPTRPTSCIPVAVGTAQVAKAVNNLILWACLVANHEALALAQALWRRRRSAARGAC